MSSNTQGNPSTDISSPGGREQDYSIRIIKACKYGHNRPNKNKCDYCNMSGKNGSVGFFFNPKNSLSLCFTSIVFVFIKDKRSKISGYL